MKNFKKQFLASMLFLFVGSVATIVYAAQPKSDEKKAEQVFLQNIIEEAVERAEEKKAAVPSVLMIAKMIGKLSWEETKTLAYLLNRVFTQKNERLENIWNLLVKSGKIAWLPLSPYLLNVLPYTPYTLTISPYVLTIFCLLAVLPPIDWSVRVLYPPVKWCKHYLKKGYSLFKKIREKKDAEPVVAESLNAAEAIV